MRARLYLDDRLRPGLAWPGLLVSRLLGFSVKMGRLGWDSAQLIASRHRVHNTVASRRGAASVSSCQAVDLPSFKRENKMQMSSRQAVRLLARGLLVLLVLFVALAELAQAGSVSKKFMKGFLLGAYMAKHHKPVIVVTKKHG